MPKICDICHRGALKGNSRSHSNIATKRWQNINLQKKTIDGKRYNLCTRCIRNIAKVPSR